METKRLKFRRLNADEIDLRIGPISKSTQRVSILPYKDARVDMAMLDETVGPENWARDHKEIKGNLYCGVGIRCGETFVWKWDCGTESTTEKEKGEASDSFKRACVNWGIGRELYTAPDIWITCNSKEWNNGSPRMTLAVREIQYDEDGTISKLVIIDQSGAVRWPEGMAAEAHEETKVIIPGGDAWNSLLTAIKRQGMKTRQEVSDAVKRQNFIISQQNLIRICVEANIAV